MNHQPTHPTHPTHPPQQLPLSTFLIFLGAVARSVRMVQWRPPPVLVLPEDLMVDPTKCASPKSTGKAWV